MWGAARAAAEALLGGAGVEGEPKGPLADAVGAGGGAGIGGGEAPVADDDGVLGVRGGPADAVDGAGAEAVGAVLAGDGACRTSRGVDEPVSLDCRLAGQG